MTRRDFITTLLGAAGAAVAAPMLAMVPKPDPTPEEEFKRYIEAQKGRMVREYAANIEAAYPKCVRIKCAETGWGNSTSKSMGLESIGLDLIPYDEVPIF